MTSFPLPYASLLGINIQNVSLLKKIFWRFLSSRYWVWNQWILSLCQLHYRSWSVGYEKLTRVSLCGIHHGNSCCVKTIFSSIIFPCGSFYSFPPSKMSIFFAVQWFLVDTNSSCRWFTSDYRYLLIANIRSSFEITLISLRQASSAFSCKTKELCRRFAECHQPWNRLTGVSQVSSRITRVLLVDAVHSETQKATFLCGDAVFLPDCLLSTVMCVCSRRVVVFFSSTLGPQKKQQPAGCSARTLLLSWSVETSCSFCWRLVAWKLLGEQGVLQITCEHCSVLCLCRKAISKSCQENNDLLHPKHAEIGYKRKELKSYVDWTVSWSWRGITFGGRRAFFCFLCCCPSCLSLPLFPDCCIHIE